MTNLVALIDRYVESWNETDPRRRREELAGTWTGDGTYVDPLFTAAGHNGIDAMLQGVQTQFPGMRLTRTSEVDAHHDRVRFAWALGPAARPALARGIDVGV